jgi:hypothetical protein
MKHSRLTVFIGAAVIFLAADLSLAQGGAGQGGQARPMMGCQERFYAMDTNKDGKVTRDEFMAQDHPGGHAEDVFKSRDANGDGVLTQDEFCSGKGMGRGMGKGKSQ